MKLGIGSERFTGPYFDMAPIERNIGKAVKVQVKQIQNWGWNSPEDLENTILVLLPVYNFHPDFSIRPQLQQNWGPSSGVHQG